MIEEIEFNQRNVASRDKRFWAYLIDTLPITTLIFMLHYFVLGFDDILRAYLEDPNAVDARAEFMNHRNRISNLSFAIWILYSAAMEASEHQATIGKLLMGIKVVSAQGEGLTHGLALTRNFSKILSALVIGMGFMWILFDKKNQGWHDKIARTFVVDKDFTAGEARTDDAVSP